MGTSFCLFPIAICFCVIVCFNKIIAASCFALTTVSSIWDKELDTFPKYLNNHVFKLTVLKLW